MIMPASVKDFFPLPVYHRGTNPLRTADEV
jgi:hypothetical protein